LKALLDTHETKRHSLTHVLVLPVHNHSKLVTKISKQQMVTIV